MFPASVGQRMPRLSDTPKHPLELAVRAGQPMVVGFKAGAVTNPPCPKAPPGYRAICSPPPGHGPTCVSTRTFVPESGVDYEAHLDFGSGRCRLDVYGGVSRNRRKFRYSKLQSRL